MSMLRPSSRQVPSIPSAVARARYLRYVLGALAALTFAVHLLLVHPHGVSDDQHAHAEQATQVETQQQDAAAVAESESSGDSQTQVASLDEDTEHGESACGEPIPTKDLCAAALLSPALRFVFELERLELSYAASDGAELSPSPPDPVSELGILRV